MLGDTDMLIVPVQGDIVTTYDLLEFEVDSYTPYKTDPAVYVKVPRGQNPIVYFQDIDLINGVKLEYNKSAKIFTALGTIKRKYNLPQPKDTITFRNTNGSGEEFEDVVEVKTIKLHNKAIGLSAKLSIVDENKTVHSLSDIRDITRSAGSEHFDRKKFLKYYEDYTSRVGHHE